MSCTWVKDDADDCPYGFWLQLRYTYNILDVEAAPKYVNDAYVYVYDADGRYVKRIYAGKDDLVATDYRVKVEGLAEGDYQFVVWSGLNDSHYAVSGDSQDMADFRLSLETVGGKCTDELPGLYYGSLSDVHYDDSFAVYDVELMKNTNQFACLIVPITEKTDLDADDFSMKVVSANGVMDVANRLTANAVTTYLPFEQSVVTVDDADYGTLSGLRFNISTLRLMSDTDCRIILEQKSTGKTLFNISLPEYIGMVGSLYTNLGRELTVQEYLDRQDFYTVVFFLSGDLEQLIQLKVNSWRLRANNHLKL